MITIELSDEQRELLWGFTRPHTAAHLAAGLEPPCVRLEIELGGPYGCEASAVIGSARRGLGEVVVQVHATAARPARACFFACAGSAGRATRQPVPAG